jgi:hypothetical protein
MKGFEGLARDQSQRQDGMAEMDNFMLRVGFGTRKYPPKAGAN